MGLLYLNDTIFSTKSQHKQLFLVAEKKVLSLFFLVFRKRGVKLLKEANNPRRFDRLVQGWTKSAATARTNFHCVKIVRNPVAMSPSSNSYCDQALRVALGKSHSHGGSWEISCESMNPRLSVLLHAELVLHNESAYHSQSRGSEALLRSERASGSDSRRYTESEHR